MWLRRRVHPRRGRIYKYRVRGSPEFSFITPVAGADPPTSARSRDVITSLAVVSAARRPTFLRSTLPDGEHAAQPTITEVEASMTVR